MFLVTLYHQENNKKGNCHTYTHVTEQHFEFSDAVKTFMLFFPHSAPKILEGKIERSSQWNRRRVVHDGLAGSLSIVERESNNATGLEGKISITIWYKDKKLLGFLGLSTF